MGKKLQKRAPITESIFGVLKTGRNYNSLKRLEKQKGIINLNIETTVHNLKIIHKNIIEKMRRRKLCREETCTEYGRPAGDTILTLCSWT